MLVLLTAMELRHLRYFCVPEQLHFTKAAVLLNVAQPALSHQIKQLEDELGTQLVERTNRRVRLTTAGEVFLARATRILEQLDQATRETARVGQGDAGSLVVGAVPILPANEAVVDTDHPRPWPRSDTAATPGSSDQRLVYFHAPGPSG